MDGFMLILSQKPQIRQRETHGAFGDVIPQAFTIPRKLFKSQDFKLYYVRR